MQLSRRSKIIAIAAVIALVAVGAPVLAITLINQSSASNSVTLTLLDNAGVMIENQGLRIYVDPINLPSDYANRPADAILITHPHDDHYQPATITMLQKEGTVNVFPANMTDAISLFDGVAVRPRDQLQVGHVHITAFYMATPTSHPREANWTSYIIDVNGFTIFHAGDSKVLPEYSELAGTIDVALLPLGPGCQAMADMEIVNAIAVLKARYFVPIHFVAGDDYIFLANYGSLITDCTIVHLSHFQSHTFQIA
jgi:L-ascorbate metabolism protein UlaG (beta-lactamase superfamily)